MGNLAAPRPQESPRLPLKPQSIPRASGPTRTMRFTRIYGACLRSEKEKRKHCKLDSLTVLGQSQPCVRVSQRWKPLREHADHVLSLSENEMVARQKQVPGAL